MLSTVRRFLIVVVAAAAVPLPTAVLGVRLFGFDGLVWLVFLAALAALVGLSRRELRARILGGAALTVVVGAGAAFAAFVVLFMGLCDGPQNAYPTALALGAAVYLAGTCVAFARGRALVWAWPASLVAGYAVGLATLALAGAHGACNFG
jgi:hypothetical protein